MLRFDNVTKHFGGLVAVDSLNLDISSGEIFGFLGPNGAGKTTTIKMVVGLMRPSSGVISLNNIDIQERPEETKRRIGYIPDNPYIYEKLTAYEFMELVAGLYDIEPKTAREQTEELFDIFGVTEWGSERVEGYSHGMRQRVVMASALLHDPELLVVDEPMVGLDPQSQHLVKQIFSERAAAGKSVFMSTHTLPVAEEVCTRIGIIHHGRLLALGARDEITAEINSRKESFEDFFLKMTKE